MIKKIIIVFLTLLSHVPAWVSPLFAQAKTNVINGRVVDAQDRSPLPGVNVYVKGTTLGVITDVNGTFALAVPTTTDTLVFSFMGYEQQEVPVLGRSSINVNLISTVIQGEEFVVIGYSAIRQRDVTGSVSTVSASDLESIAQVSVNQMLRGKAPGLDIRARSAQPGGGATVNVRGALSPRGNNAPLYVIDGVPITNNSSSVSGLNSSDLGFYGGNDRDPLTYLSPGDIESISILKDASSTAIYGSAAANGVILITTKNGKYGNVQVDYRGSVSTQVVQNYFPLLDGKEFMEQQDRLAYDRYLFENNLAPYGNAATSSAPAYNRLFSEEDIAAAGAGTNWIDLISRRGVVNEHNISMTGGNERTKVFSSFNINENEAILQNSSLTRVSGRFNVDQKFSNYVSLSTKATLSRMKGNNASTGSNSGGSEKFNMIQSAMAYGPTVQPRDSSGAFNSTFNPLIMSPAAFLEIADNVETTKIFAAPNLKISFSEGLSLNVVGQVDYEASTRKFYLPRITNNAQLPDGMAQKNQNVVENYTAETYLTYNTTLGKGDFSFVLGSGYYETNSEGFGLQAVGFFTDAFDYYNIGVSEDVLRNSIYSYRNARNKLSQFVRTNYSLKEKYIFSFVARRDGSSIFSENNKYGVFPGVSAAWLISEEGFMKKVASFSNLKVRVGFGLAGNESVLTGNTLQLYRPGYPYLIGQNELNGVALSQIANPNLTWETIETLNFGLDFGFFRNRISGSIDVYQRTAKDLLDFAALPANNAVGQIADNVGSTRSNGVEVSIKTSNILRDKMSWYSIFNVTFNKSFWLERNPQVPLPSFVGENDELSTIYGWKTDGIIKSLDDIPAHMPNAALGNIIYVDQNGDGLLDSEDVVQLGTYTPRWLLGFNNDFMFGNFDIGIHMYGSLGFKVWNNFAPNSFAISQSINPSNTTVFARDIWSASHPTGNLPGMAPNPYDGSNPASNDFFLQDGSFLRISNIDVGYNLDKLMGNWFRSARLFASVQNIAVLTRYSGFDPEFTETNPYPMNRSYTIGVDFKF